MVFSNRFASFTLYIVGGVVLLCSLVVLAYIDQDVKCNVGQTGGALDLVQLLLIIIDLILYFVPFLECMI